MNKFAITRNAAIFAFLVTCGVVARVAFQHIPNFAPVAALALFAGYFFTSRMLAVAVPFSVMLISDRLVDAGGYSLPLMLTVYALLALPVFVSGPWRRTFSSEPRSLFGASGSTLGLFGCTLACSLIFFLGTNLAVWATSSWYEHTLSGLLTCYTSALPFFRFTVAGDACFALVLFGGYAAIRAANRETTTRVVLD